MTAPQELALWRAIEDGDEAGSARKQLLEANLRLVVPIARRYEGRGVSFLDLVQAGNIGLVRAVERFDPSAGGAFTSLACGLIEDAIADAIG